MKVILYDLDETNADRIAARCDRALSADGRYAPCQGCFGCWTKHPAECKMKDTLRQVCRVIGQADELVIVTRNLYGGYSAAVKNVLDRSYGRHDLWKVIVYGEITEAEQASFRYLAERNALNDGYQRSEVVFLKDLSELEAQL